MLLAVQYISDCLICTSLQIQQDIDDKAIEQEQRNAMSNRQQTAVCMHLHIRRHVLTCW